MLKQKRRDQLKQYEKQEKRIKDMKASGKSKKQAVSWQPARSIQCLRSFAVYSVCACVLTRPDLLSDEKHTSVSNSAKAAVEPLQRHDGTVLLA